MFGWRRSFIVRISLFTWKKELDVSERCKIQTTTNLPSLNQKEAVQRNGFWKFTWLVRLFSTTICLSMILIATYCLFSVFIANLTLAKVPSPIVRPTWYFPMALTYPIFLLPGISLSSSSYTPCRCSLYPLIWSNVVVLKKEAIRLGFEELSCLWMGSIAIFLVNLMSLKELSCLWDWLT